MNLKSKIEIMEKSTSLKKFENKGKDKKDEKDKWSKLLRPYKVIKDPVHKDIWLTEVETKIIDTPEFQRLRYIKQLGPTYLIYPGANHTRFDHSIGTVDVAQKIINNINRNSKTYNECLRLSSEDIFLIRLVALLHDAAHLPFGHLIEDEGKIIKEKQWKDDFRCKKLLGENSNIRKRIVETLEEYGIDEQQANNIIDELIEILKHVENGESEKDKNFDKQYIADIVGNTICADLLDYIKRDIYFTGIYGQYDERLFAYFVLLKDNKGRKKVVIKLSKPKEKKPRYDVISAMIDLIHLRYSIAEKIYHHHTRQKLSAMIIEMVEAAFKAGILDKEKLFELNDENLFNYIINYTPENENSGLKISKEQKYLEIAKKIALKIKNRNLYKDVFNMRIGEYHSLEIKPNVKRNIDELIENWEKRFDFERLLEERLNLEDGDIIIYAPNQEMGSKKEIETNVEYKGEIDSLENIASGKKIFNFIEKDIKLVSEKHKNLWNFMVLCSREKYDEYKVRIYNVCEEWFTQETFGEDLASLLQGEGYDLSSLEKKIRTIPATMPRGNKCRLRYILETIEGEVGKKKN